MAIVHRSTTAQGESAKGTIFGITPSTSPTLLGSTLIMCISARSTSITTNAPTDTAGNTWVKITGASQDATPQYLEMWWCKNAAAITSASVNFSGSMATAFTLTEVTGLGATPTVDVTMTHSGSSTSASVGPSATTAAASEFAIGTIGYLNNTTMTFPGGAWANAQQANSTISANNITVGTASQVLSSTGVLSYSGSGFTSAAWMAALATFQPASANNGSGFLPLL